MSGNETLEKEFISFREKFVFISHFITKIILYVVISILIIIYALSAIYFGNLLHNINKNENRPPLFNAYIIVSPSMVPNIMIQDGIVIKRENPKKLENGDIITFETHDVRYDGLIITHRIVGSEKTEDGNYYFRTKGDANTIEDSYLVKKEDIYGKVLFKLPKIGYVRDFFNNTLFVILLLIIPCLFILVYDLLKLVKYIKKNNNKEEGEEELEII